MGLTHGELMARFGGDLGEASSYLPSKDEAPCIEVPPEKLIEVLGWLRSEAEPRYEMLVDMTATDESLPGESEPGRPVLRPGAKKRFRLVYHLASTPPGSGRSILRLVLWTGEEDRIPSVSSLWTAADWLEREVFDLFGILFSGHPDLKRILMPDGYEGHPLRKDFPLRGIEPDRLYREWDLSREA